MKRTMQFFGLLLALSLLARLSLASPASRLLILEKSDNMLALVDPETLRVIARVPAGPDPHEIVATPDGKFCLYFQLRRPG